MWIICNLIWIWNLIGHHVLWISGKKSIHTEGGHLWGVQSSSGVRRASIRKVGSGPKWGVRAGPEKEGHWHRRRGSSGAAVTDCHTCGSLKQQKSVLSDRKGRSLKSQCLQGGATCQGSRREALLASLPASGGCRPSLACLTSVFVWPSPLLPVCLCPVYLWEGHLSLENPRWSHLESFNLITSAKPLVPSKVTFTGSSG